MSLQSLPEVHLECPEQLCLWGEGRLPGAWVWEKGQVRNPKWSWGDSSTAIPVGSEVKLDSFGGWKQRMGKSELLWPGREIGKNCFCCVPDGRGPINCGPLEHQKLIALWWGRKAKVGCWVTTKNTTTIVYKCYDEGRIAKDRRQMSIQGAEDSWEKLLAWLCFECQWREYLQKLIKTSSVLSKLNQCWQINV